MGLVVRDFKRYWPRSRMPYEIDPALPPGSLGHQAVLDAIAQWNQTAAIQLVPRAGEKDYVVYMSGASGTGCSSAVGRQGGRQEIPCDLAWAGIPAVMHETGHAVGLIHEHQRSDRDQYIDVDSAVQNGKDFKIDSKATRIGNYDCVSLMHYPPETGKIAIKPGGCPSVGGATGLSPGDQAALRYLYPTIEVWRSKWTKDWTALVPFSLKGQAFLLAYKGGTGEVDIDRLNADGQGTTTVWEGKWTKGWTALVPFVLNGKSYLLAYKGGSGTVAIDVIKGGGQGTTTVWEGKWTKGWTALVPFVLNGKSYLLAYKGGSGTVAIDVIKGGGQGTTTVWEGKWTKGWSLMVPYLRNAIYHIGSYKTNSGRADFDLIRTNAQGTTVVGRTRWSKGWTALVPFELNGQTFLLSYKKASGTVAIDRVT